MSSIVISSQSTQSAASCAESSSTGSDAAVLSALTSHLNELKSSAGAPPLTPAQEKAKEQAQAWQDAVGAAEDDFRKNGEPVIREERAQMQQEIRVMISEYPSVVSPKLADLLSEINAISTDLRFYGTGKAPVSLVAALNKLNAQYNEIIKPYLDPTKLSKTIPMLTKKIIAAAGSKYKSGTQLYTAIHSLRSTIVGYNEWITRGKWLDQEAKKVEAMWREVPGGRPTTPYSPY